MSEQQQRYVVKTWMLDKTKSQRESFGEWLSWVSQEEQLRVVCFETQINTQELYTIMVIFERIGNEIS